MATATAPLDERTRKALAELVVPVLEDVVGPSLDAVAALRDACDELADDAALGRRARAIVQEHATRRIDRELARQGLLGVMTAPTIRFPVANPPTEAEIRDLVESDHYAWGQLSDAFTALGGTLDRLYDSEDLRKSELEDLDTAAADELDAIRERARADAVEALVRAGLAFAAKHPDAPRAAREAAPA